MEENETKVIFRKRKAAFEERKQSLDSNDVNLCLVGTYSAGKSTFINAVIGKRILPESINSETAKMFKIKNGEIPKVSFLVHSKQGAKPDNIQIAWNENVGQFEVQRGIGP